MENLEAVDTTGESAVEETPDHTPEAEVETEDAELESPETEETEESVTDAEEAELPVEEDFSDLEENFIPSDEQISKLRIPKEERERLKVVAKVARESSEKVEKFGGDFAMDAFQPFAEVITKPQISDVEGNAILDKLFEANPNVTYQILSGAAATLLSNEQSANQILTNLFGDNADVKNIKTLLALDKEGIIDKDWGGESEAILELRRENDELKSRLESQGTPEPDIRGDRASKDFETDFYSNVREHPKLREVFKLAGWSEDSVTAKLVAEVLAYRLKDDQKYKDTDQFVRQNGAYRNGDRIVGVADANLMVLKNRAFAIGKELVREIQKERRSISENSRNRAIAEKTKSKPVETIPVPLPKTDDSKARLEKARRAYIEQYNASMKASS